MGNLILRLLAILVVLFSAMVISDSIKASGSSNTNPASDIFYGRLKSSITFTAGAIIPEADFTRPFIFAHTSVVAAVLAMVASIMVLLATFKSSWIPDVVYTLSAYIIAIYLIWVAVSSMYLLFANPVDVVIGVDASSSTVVYRQYKLVKDTVLGSSVLNWLGSAAGITSVILFVTEFDNKGANAAADKRGLAFKTGFSK